MHAPHPRAKHFKDDGTWVCPVCLYHDMFLKEEMEEAWAIVENASNIMILQPVQALWHDEAKS